jgi:hypothetical protein
MRVDQLDVKEGVQGGGVVQVLHKAGAVCVSVDRRGVAVERVPAAATAAVERVPAAATAAVLEILCRRFADSDAHWSSNSCCSLLISRCMLYFDVHIRIRAGRAAHHVGALLAKPSTPWLSPCLRSLVQRRHQLRLCWLLLRPQQTWPLPNAARVLCGATH